MGKDEFYQKMQQYFDENLVREVYCCDYFSILNFGEICYVCCPFNALKKDPVVMYVTESFIRKIIDDNSYLYKFLLYMLENMDKYGNVFKDLSPKYIDYWKNKIFERKQKGISQIDYKFEQELAEISKNKK